MNEIVSFTSTFSNTSKYRVTTVFLSHVMNKFLHDDGLTYTSTSEHGYLTTFNEGAKKVDGFDTGFKDLYLTRLLGKVWSFGVNWSAFYFSGKLGSVIDWFTNNV